MHNKIDFPKYWPEIRDRSPIFTINACMCLRVWSAFAHVLQHPRRMRSVNWNGPILARKHTRARVKIEREIGVGRTHALQPMVANGAKCSEAEHKLCGDIKRELVLQSVTWRAYVRVYIIWIYIMYIIINHRIRPNRPCGRINVSSPMRA